MKITIDRYYFASELSNDKRNGFSYEGALVLFDYLEELEQYEDNELEFDAVALRCRFTEGDAKEIVMEYIAEEEWEHIEDYEDFIILLEEYTTVINVDNETVIYEEF